MIMNINRGDKLTLSDGFSTDWEEKKAGRKAGRFTNILEDNYSVISQIINKDLEGQKN